MFDNLMQDEIKTQRFPPKAIQFDFPTKTVHLKSPRTFAALRRYERRPQHKEHLHEKASRGSLEMERVRGEDPALPPIGSFSPGLELRRSPKSRGGSLQLSYTSLSNLKKRQVKAEIGIKKTKVPYSRPPEPKEEYRREEEQKTPQKFTSLGGETQDSAISKGTRGFLNQTIDNKPIHEKILEKKALLQESIKEFDGGELEGARVYAKCYQSAVHSIEEKIENEEIQYFFIKLVLSLMFNFRSYNNAVNKRVKGFKEEIEAQVRREKILHSELEVEKKQFREQLEKDRQKFELKPVVQELRKLTERYNQLKINIDKERKDLMNQISLLTVSNKNLAEKLKTTQEETDIVRMTSTIQNLRAELHQMQENLKKEKEEKSNSCFKLYTILDATKKEVRDRDKLISIKDEEYNTLLEAYNKVLQELEKNRALMKENIENNAMTVEDILQIKFRFLTKTEELRERDSLIKELNGKIIELETQLKLQREGFSQQKEISLESVLFYFVADNLPGQLHNRSKSKAREGKQDLVDIEEKTDFLTIAKRIQETGEVQLDSINTRKYQYLRPNYKAFIENLLPSDPGKKMNYSPSFPMWLQVVIRSIFDAKYNEYLYSAGKNKKISPFPEFVYAWLGTFAIDKDTRSVRLMEYTEKDTLTDENRVNLLLGLEAASASKLWEIHIFKDFLEETLSLDELVFFLHCRFLLFKGPQTAIATSGFCVTHFVTKDRVYDTIDRVLYKSKLEERRELKKKLLDFNRATYKDGNAFDYAMVLRILLELYKKERKENFVKLEELYSMVRKSSAAIKTVIPFESFYEILAGEYDKSLTDLEVSNLFREAYIGGGCAVTLDSTLLTLCETPFWVKYLRLKGQNLEPKYDARGDIDQTDDKGKECAAVYKHWEENEDIFSKVRHYIISSGMLDQLTKLDYLENYIRWKGKEDSSKYSGRSMLQVYRFMWLQIMELFCVNEEKYQFHSDAEYKHDVSKELEVFQLIGDLFVTKLNKLSKLEEKKQSALEFEQNFSQATKGNDLIAKIQTKLKEDEISQNQEHLNPGKTQPIHK